MESWCLLGRVTMDMCMTLVDDSVAIGDVGTIYGGLVPVDRQAEAGASISYELLVRLGARVPRIFQSP
jgi:alanine racemase